MRCVGCGENMRLVQAAADRTMMVPGYEHQTLECPGCREVERRLVFARPIAPLPDELLRVPSGTPASPTPKQHERMHAPKAWPRALERLRSRQSALKERAEVARASEAVRQFHQTWDALMPHCRDAPPAKLPTPAEKRGLSSPAKLSLGKDRDQHGAAPIGAFARMAAKLRSHQAAISARRAVKDHSFQGQPFDQLWENLGPSPRRSMRSDMPQPTPLAKSRCLVPIESNREAASSARLRAAATLQQWQDRDRAAIKKAIASRKIERSDHTTISTRITVKEHSHEGQAFDQLWEDLGPSSRRSTPSDKSTPRPTPLAKSRSLVPIESSPGAASSAWVRAVAMLQLGQDRVATNKVIAPREINRLNHATISTAIAVKESSLEDPPFDKLWENLGPNPRGSTPSDKPPTPRPIPLAKPKTQPGSGLERWLREVLMLQEKQERDRAAVNKAIAPHEIDNVDFTTGHKGETSAL